MSVPETTSPADASRQACEAHTDLNIMAAVVSILEGGHLYTRNAKATARKIIKLCEAEQQRQLHAYDAAIYRAAQGDSPCETETPP